jgi:hypothetical protein
MRNLPEPQEMTERMSQRRLAAIMVADVVGYRKYGHGNFCTDLFTSHDT